MTYRRIRVLPQPAAAGAEVRCGSLQNIDEETFREIYKAWLDHLVLVFRNQQITDAEFLAFSQRFGPLKASPVGEQKPGDTRREPELHVVSNVRQNGIPIGILGDGEVDWHTDMASFDQPPTATVLYALEVPSKGGDTFFQQHVSGI